MTELKRYRIETYPVFDVFGPVSEDPDGHWMSAKEVLADRRELLERLEIAEAKAAAFDALDGWLRQRILTLIWGEFVQGRMPKYDTLLEAVEDAMRKGGGDAED